ncbi:hypothetical protein ACHAXR_006968, partial [Thalassiosira sp. AJA248-18]
KLKPSPRPYTTYNIFFQLKREYILQHDLDVTPNLRPEEIFDCSDKNYEGPALPLKYSSIILRNDWFLPGKALRKKRQHRATHGKISFIDLSKKVASSWHNSDRLVKLFCAQVSDIGMMKYKREMYNFKKVHIIAKENLQPSPGKNQTIKPKIVVSSKQSVTASSKTMACPLILCPEIISSSSSLPVKMPSLPVEISSFLKDISSEPQGRSNNGIGFVDMQDDEIVNIWTSLDEPLLI